MVFINKCSVLCIFWMLRLISDFISIELTLSKESRAIDCRPYKKRILALTEFDRVRETIELRSKSTLTNINIWSRIFDTWLCFFQMTVSISNDFTFLFISSNRIVHYRNHYSEVKIHNLIRYLILFIPFIKKPLIIL